MFTISAARSNRVGLASLGFIASNVEASDEALMAAIAEKDTRAMRVLYIRHSLTVFRFVMRLTKDASLAEDLVSTVFIDAWRSAAPFKAHSKVSTWLLAIARNRSWSALRERREMQLDDDYAATIEDTADSPEQMADKLDRASVVQACLNTLSPDHREVIDLIYYHEKSSEEVAEILGVLPATVKTRAFYARSRMAEMLKEYGIEHAVS